MILLQRPFSGSLWSGCGFWHSADSSLVSQCLRITDNVVSVLFKHLAVEFDAINLSERRQSLPKKTKLFQRRRDRGLLCRRILVKSLSKILLFFWRREIHKRLIKSTHQTNGTYIYRINTKLKTYEHISWKFKRKKNTLFFF